MLHALLGDRAREHLRIDREAPHTIVGVVGNERQTGLAEDPRPEFLAPYGQEARNAMTLVVWTNLPVSLDNKTTANTLAVEILDQIYVQSPLGARPAADTTVPDAAYASAP